MEHAHVSVPIHVIAAGKFRRYHGVPIWKQLLDIPTVLKNIRDLAFITLGLFQSLLILRRFKPDVVFAKGGYVCLPLGYAARILSIPLVIHDSDARPGLTSSLLARFATAIATGAPVENYSYPADRTVQTGVPIDSEFHPFSPAQQREARHELGIADIDKPLVVVTGGGLGAESINVGMIAIGDQLLDDGYAVYHVTGKRHYETVKKQAPEHPDYAIAAFVYKDMVRVLGAADIVVSRGSATFLQELAALAKPTVIVPAGHLGDQVKNAAVYLEADAAQIVDDEAARRGGALYDAIKRYQDDPQMTASMTERFHQFAKADAALDVAMMIVDAGTKKA